MSDHIPYQNNNNDEIAEGLANAIERYIRSVISECQASNQDNETLYRMGVKFCVDAKIDMINEIRKTLNEIRKP